MAWHRWEAPVAPCLSEAAIMASSSRFLTYISTPDQASCMGYLVYVFNRQFRYWFRDKIQLCFSKYSVKELGVNCVPCVCGVEVIDSRNKWRSIFFCFGDGSLGHIQFSLHALNSRFAKCICRLGEWWEDCQFTVVDLWLIPNRESGSISLVDKRERKLVIRIIMDVWFIYISCWLKRELYSTCCRYH